MPEANKIGRPSVVNCGRKLIVQQEVGESVVEENTFLLKTSKREGKTQHPRASRRETAGSRLHEKGKKSSKRLKVRRRGPGKKKMIFRVK